MNRLAIMHSVIDTRQTDRQHYDANSRSQCVQYRTRNQVAWWTWLARAVWQTQRGTSVSFLQSSRWSLCHFSQSSISAYETNTPRWSHYSHKFHPHLCTNWCLQIFVLFTHTSRLEHSVCWSPSQVLVVCKRVSWSGRLSHDTPAVKGDAHCWIFAEELKNWRTIG